MALNMGTEAQTHAAPLTNREYLKDLARAFGGALIFSLPLLMTMEMWWLGFYMDRLRLAVLLLITLPLLTVLADQGGFREDFGPRDLLLDTLVAFAVGYLLSALILALLGRIQWGMSLDEVIGKVALQAVPGSIGAMFASSQLGSEHKNRPQVSRGYVGELLLMVAGALFLAFNLAPTEEMVLLAYHVPVTLILALVGFSLLSMHAFVYALEFRGQEPLPENSGHLGIFLRFTVVGYALVLLTSLLILWIFGRTDGMALVQIVEMTTVLGFPAAIGAAAARLLL
jgi:putative integral membrane protein (TIGR02587 family)